MDRYGNSNATGKLNFIGRISFDKQKSYSGGYVFKGFHHLSHIKSMEKARVLGKNLFTTITLEETLLKSLINWIQLCGVDDRSNKRFAFLKHLLKSDGENRSFNQQKYHGRF